MLKINFHIYYFITSFLSFNLTLFFYYPSFAQPGNLSIKNYPFSAFEVKKHTVGAQNWAATQDKRGVMYFGNNGEGVLEYDGNSWRMIPVSNRNTVASLAADTNGRIYVGGVSEFGYLKPDSSGIMTYVSLTDYLKAEDKKFSNIWHIHIIDSSVYFQARTKLFYLSNLNDLPSKVNIKVINPKTGFHTSYYVHKKLFVRQQGIGLMQLQNDTLAEIPSGEQFANNPIYTMLPFDNNRILISTRNSGLFVYDGTNAIPFPTEADKFLNEKIIYTGTMLPDSSFALGTATGGIAVIDRRGNFKYIIDKASGLLNNMVRGVFVDREGDLWIALNNGISKAEISLPFLKFNEESGLEGSVYDILRHKDKLYIATSQGLKYYDDDFFKQIFYKERIGNTLLKALPVQGIKLETWSLIKFNDIVLAGSSDGIFVVDGNIGTGIGKQYQSVFSLIRSTLDSTIVYAAVKNGLAVLRYNNEKWNDLGRIKNLTEEIRSLAETPDGYVWTGSNSQGVIRIDFRQGYTPDPVIDKFDTSDGLPENVWTFVFSVAGKITIASEKGFYRLVENTDLPNKKKGYFIPDSTLGSEFAGGASYALLLREEANGNLWMYGKEGLGKAIRKDDGTYQWDFQTFKSIDDPFTFTLFPDKNNLAWIGGKNGMICYNEKINKNRDLSFNALIRKVTTTNDSIIFGGSFYDEKWLSVLSQNKLLKPVLDYADNVLRFEFAAPFFGHEESNGYQYYLEGFDKDWSEWSMETKKEYTNLHEGNYKFRVHAENIYGHGSNEATYEFTILAPWYRTLWAYSGYMLLFLGFVYAVVRISIFRLKKAKKRLEKIIKQSTAEIVAQKNTLEKAYIKLKDLENFKESMTGMIVHDLKNPLNTIIGFSDRDKTSKNELASINQSGKQMLNMVLNILDVQKFEDAEVKLSSDNFSVLSAAEDGIKQVQQLILQKGIRLDNKIEDKWYGNFDFELISRVFVNILTNAIKYTPSAGNITIDATTFDNNCIKVSITDTGSGIPSDKLDKVFDKFSQIEARKSGGVKSTGIGLTFCKLVIEAHKGKVWAESELGKGTTFFFTFLIGKKVKDDEKIVKKMDVKIEEIVLTEKAKTTLLPFLKDFKSISVFDASENNNILRKIEENGNDAIKTWKEEMDTAVFNCNEEKYNYLINLIK